VVEVAWNEDTEGVITSLCCRGHADFEGDVDVVCAAVSALTGSLGLGFSQVLTLPHQITVEDGTFELRLEQGTEVHPDFRAAQVLLKTTVLALGEMIQYYPGFIRRSSGEGPRACELGR